MRYGWNPIATLRVTRTARAALPRATAFEHAQLAVTLAVLDLGSNSFHLLVARRSSSRGFEKIGSYKETPRLGAAVQAHGRLPEEAFRGALASVGTLAQVARRLGAEAILAVGTSALRSAQNGGEFVEAAAQQHGISVELLSGEEEGRLVYHGARSGLSQLPKTVGVVDIGGGSVEVAIGDPGGCHFVHSLPLGFLRCAEGHGADVALGAQLVCGRVFTECQRLASQLERYRPEAWVFSGGTARALAKLLGGDGVNLPSGLLRTAARKVLKSSPNRLLELGVDPRRVDTLGFGVAVLQGVIDGFGVDSIRVSPWGLREGVLLGELERRAEGSGAIASVARRGLRGAA